MIVDFFSDYSTSHSLFIPHIEDSQICLSSFALNLQHAILKFINLYHVVILSSLLNTSSVLPDMDSTYLLLLMDFGTRRKILLALALASGGPSILRNFGMCITSHALLSLGFYVLFLQTKEGYLDHSLSSQFSISSLYFCIYLYDITTEPFII